MSFLHPKMERRRNPPAKSLLLNIVVYVLIGIYYLCKGNFFLVINMKRLSVFLILLILLPFVVGCKHRDVSPQYRYLDSIFKKTYGDHLPQEVRHLLIFNVNNGVCGDCAQEYLSFIHSLSYRKDILVLLNLSRLDTMGWWKSNDIKLNKLLRYVDEDINLANPLSNLAYIAIGDGTIDTIMYIESPPTENINYLRDVRGLK
jgi:hypothetical protein